MSERGANDFRERARVEADRYGPDPWIFVRELLQNARDAGSRGVVITVEEGQGITRVRCRDDGEGMSYEHARRYLFSLYASSKEERSNQVGRFGVGFWSILRFDPTRIVIRSCPRERGAGGPWQVVLDGELQNAERTAVDMSPGTEIVLERPAGDGADERRVFEAAHQNARFLCCRDDPERPLPVTVNGRSVNADFALDAPSSSFRRGHVRGVVGLGNAPRVELFSRGLRVRSAACLDDLLTNAGYTNHSRVRFPELPGGLAPQALLESDGLELLLSRSDARDTRTLRRLVKLGQNELRRLVERQLARVRPPGIGERLVGLVRALAESNWSRAALGALTGAILALVIAHLLWPGEFTIGAAVDPNAAPPSTRDRTRYGDLRPLYHGPRVSEINAAAAEPLDLRYTPRDAHPYFAALIIERVSGDAGAAATLTDRSYSGQTCVHGCIDVVLPIYGDGQTPLSLPIPSGHRLDVDSVELELDASAAQDVGSLRVLASSAGEAMLIIDSPIEGTLRYRTGPGAAIRVPPRSDDALPQALRREAAALRSLEFEDRLTAAINLVRARVRYETSSTVSDQHERAQAQGMDFITRTLEIGAGDCDIQNGLLVAVLHAADIDARLAVGWVGKRGRVMSWLHAWVEYRGPDGHWHVADATARGTDAGSSIAGIPSAPPEVAVGTIEVNPGPSPAVPTPSPPPTGTQPALAPIEAPGVDALPGREGSRVRDRLPPALIAALDGPYVPAAAFASGLLGLLLLGVSLSRRTARRFHLDEGTDLSGLLQGALAQPAAFRHLPSLFHRRLIPLRNGSAISLNRARALASDGRLYAGAEQTELCRTARRRGVILLDSETPEGRTVAASLGAVDLDRWGQRLQTASELPVLTAVSTYLRAQGERWRCASLRRLGERVATLDLRPLGASGSIGERLVLVDGDNPWLDEAAHLYASTPHAATFALLDHLLDHLELGPERRARLLAPLADLALRETARLDEAAQEGPHV